MSEPVRQSLTSELRSATKILREAIANGTVAAPIDCDDRSHGTLAIRLAQLEAGVALALDGLEKIHSKHLGSVTTARVMRLYALAQAARSALLDSGHCASGQCDCSAHTNGRPSAARKA